MSIPPEGVQLYTNFMVSRFGKGGMVEHMREFKFKTFQEFVWYLQINKKLIKAWDEYRRNIPPITRKSSKLNSIRTVGQRSWWTKDPSSELYKLLIKLNVGKYGSETIVNSASQPVVSFSSSPIVNVGAAQSFSQSAAPINQYNPISTQPQSQMPRRRQLQIDQTEEFKGTGPTATGQPNINTETKTIDYETDPRYESYYRALNTTVGYITPTLKEAMKIQYPGVDTEHIISEIQKEFRRKNPQPNINTTSTSTTTSIPIDYETDPRYNRYYNNLMDRNGQLNVMDMMATDGLTIGESERLIPLIKAQVESDRNRRNTETKTEGHSGTEGHPETDSNNKIIEYGRLLEPRIESSRLYAFRNGYIKIANLIEKKEIDTPEAYEIVQALARDIEAIITIPNPHKVQMLIDDKDIARKMLNLVSVGFNYRDED